ncbi:MAG TPA: globin [Vitreimonas sp.]|uniref:globin n=1 Tax=Vitreimonas sp. TaxID=3069702 RepID=UPI002D6BCC3E|nr:globin [Vitreimonas sp.]HYD87227.1 globin [Vitreimonas sp.]
MTVTADASPILASLELAGERGGDLTAAVYANMFAARPELEPLFVMDTDGAVRGEMLARAFEAIVDFVGKRSYADHLIGAEATNHDGYNVPREAFSAFFGFIRDEVQNACGDGWTDEMDQAWRRLLADLERYIAAPA